MNGGIRMGWDTKDTKPYTQYRSFVSEKKRKKRFFFIIVKLPTQQQKKKSIIWMLMLFCSAQNKTKFTAPGETENKFLKTF